MNVPVLYIAYNRPDYVRATLPSVIRNEPRKLYISVDGPKDSDEDRELVIEVIKIIKGINGNFPIEIKIETINHGCKIGVTKALDWFFEKEDLGIIIEDDVLVNKEFFQFTEYMLNNYKNDKQVFAICGFNPVTILGNDDFHFSEVLSVWGWASWRDRWCQYRRDMGGWPSNELKKMMRRRFGKITADYYSSNFDLVKENKIDTWDYQLSYTLLINGLLCIKSNKNLVENIGIFGVHARGITSNQRIKYNPSLRNKNYIKKNIKYSKLRDYAYYKFNLEPIIYKSKIYNIINKLRKLLNNV